MLSMWLCIIVTASSIATNACWAEVTTSVLRSVCSAAARSHRRKLGDRARLWMLSRSRYHGSH